MFLGLLTSGCSAQQAHIVAVSPGQPPDITDDQVKAVLVEVGKAQTYVRFVNSQVPLYLADRYHAPLEVDEIAAVVIDLTKCITIDENYLDNVLKLGQDYKILQEHDAALDKELSTAYIL
jgi:hypothetical protein